MELRALVIAASTCVILIAGVSWWSAVPGGHGDGNGVVRSSVRAGLTIPMQVDPGPLRAGWASQGSEKRRVSLSHPQRSSSGLMEMQRARDTSEPVSGKLTGEDVPEWPQVEMDAYETSRQLIRRQLAEDGEVALLEHLRSDDLRWNATLSADKLVRAINDSSEVRATLRPHLEQHLASSDQQLRVLATSLCVRVEVREARSGQPISPHPEIRAAALRWLTSPYSASDRLEFETSATPSAAMAKEFCLLHAAWMEQDLLGLMGGGDQEERFVAAVVLGNAARTRHCERIAAVLVPHLRDNKIEGDALEAMHALKRLGSPVIPFLESALESSTDKQERVCLESTLAEIKSPGSSRKIKQAVDGMPISRRCAHPAADWAPRWVPGYVLDSTSAGTASSSHR